MNRYRKMPQTIDAIYAWVATDPDGGEGVCAHQIDRMMMPLVGADMDRARALRPYAERVRQESGYPVRLVRFFGREDMEELP